MSTWTLDSSATAGSRLQGVATCARQLTDGTLVFLAYDPAQASPNQLGLYYSPSHAGTPTLIARVSATYFNLAGCPASLALAVDQYGDLFVVGAFSAATDHVVVQAFTFTGTLGSAWSWTAQQVVNQSATVWAGQTLVGFAACWCGTTTSGHIMLLCDAENGNHYAATLGASTLLTNAYSGVQFIVSAAQPAFLAPSPGAYTGTNIDLSADGFGATTGICLTSVNGTSVQLGSWGLTSSGQFTTGCGLTSSAVTTGALSGATKCRLVRIASGRWIAVIPGSGGGGQLDAYLVSSAYLPNTVGYLVGVLSGNMALNGSTLSWDAVAAPTSTQPQACWVYTWSSTASHLDDLLRLPLTVVVPGTAYVGAGAVQSPNATSPTTDYAAVSGGGTSADMTVLQLVAAPQDLLHVDWMAYKSDSTYGLYGTYSVLPEAPNAPTLGLTSGSSPSPDGSGNLALPWTFSSNMPSDAQAGAFVRRSSAAGYQWWTCSTEVAAGSNGVNVSSYAGSGSLHVTSGDQVGTFPSTGTLCLVLSGTAVFITYTGIGGTTGAVTSFTGCTTLNSAAGVLATNDVLASASGTATAAWTAAQSGASSGAEAPAPVTTAQTVTAGTWTVGTQYTYSVQTIGATGLLSGYAVDASFVVANVAPPTPQFSPSPSYSASTNTTTVTLALGAGDTTSVAGSIEFSDDGGTTWNALDMTLSSFPAAVVDWEVNPTATREYRGQTWTGVPAGYSAYCYATVTATVTVPWLTDPATGTTMQVNIVPGTFHMHRLEDLTVQYPWQRKYPLVVHGALHGNDVEVTFITYTAAQEAAFETLIQLQTPLLLVTPEPGAWYVVRTTGVTTQRPQRMATGIYLHPEQFVQVQRPTP